MEPQLVFQHGHPSLYCMECDHYHAADEECAIFHRLPRGYVIDSGYLAAEQQNGSPA